MMLRLHLGMQALHSRADLGGLQIVHGDSSGDPGLFCGAVDILSVPLSLKKTC